MYKVIQAFTDLRTGAVYHPGDVYPGTDEERIEELSTKANAQGRPVIKKVTQRKKKQQHN